MQIVYVLTNPAMPGLVKIGKTAQADASTRLAQLYSTGVPVPFELVFACKVDDAGPVEKALHIAFGPNRINPQREFFRIHPEQAIAILKLLHTEDATAEVSQQPTGIDSQSVAAAQELRSRRPNLNFHEMGIPDGSELQSADGSAIATVAGPKKVLLDGNEMSLSAATRKVLEVDYAVAPAPHWTYLGRKLSDIYEHTYGTDD